MLKKLLLGWMSLALVFQPVALADPCGMVPPIYLGQGAPITRVGLQKTYVFYKDGLETLVLRPGFDGQVDEFGMLIPFPSPPSIRKVADDVFGHIAAAIDPPEVVVDLRWGRFRGCGDVAAPAMKSIGYAGEQELRMKRESVVVLSQEAVGMYEVAVLQAGSASALSKWMEEHDFRYPDGMDATCDEYVAEGWCFVAVKARVGDKSATEPRPGMRAVDASLNGAGFDGHVQAMGFRFRTDELVVPMRLSAFNPGELHNVVYILSDRPQKIDRISEDYVVRQIPGWQLFRNVTDPLPLRVLGGDLDEIPDWRRDNLKNERDPKQWNGIARDLFAADLLALQTGNLSHELEEREKALLNIGERLGLRGAEIDRLVHAELAEERERIAAAALQGLHGMTLTVVDGDFPRDVLAEANLTFSDYSMAAAKNVPELYDSKLFGPATGLGGTLGFDGTNLPPSLLSALAVLGLVALAVVAVRRSRRLVLVTSSVGITAACVLGFATDAHAQEGEIVIRCGMAPDAIELYLNQARNAEALVDRGWAIVALAEGPADQRAKDGLRELASNSNSSLVRTWAAAGQLALSTTVDELFEATQQIGSFPAIERPVKSRWLALMAEGEVETETILRAAAQWYGLQPALLPAVLAAGPEELMPVLLTSPHQEARNLAAACLATLAQDPEQRVALRVLNAYRFDALAEDVPWAGGPLFVPACSWTRGEARQLSGALVAWHLWCDVNERSEAKRAIHNNLASVGLAHLVGYEIPSWDPDTTTTEQWLSAWGKAVGRAGLESLLAQLGLDDDAHYASVLNSLD